MFQQAAGLFTAVSAPVPESTTEQKPTPDLGSDCALALSEARQKGGTCWSDNIVFTETILSHKH